MPDLVDKSNSLFLDDPWLAAAGITMVLVLTYAELFFHEAGHWVMARLCGHRIIGFSTGQGPVIHQRLNPKACRFAQLRLWPVSGYVLPVNWSGKETRLQHFLVYLGGPLFSALFGIAMFLLYRFANFSVIPQPWNIVLQHVCMISCMLAAIDVLYNTFPQRIRGTLANDGMGMLNALVGSGFPRKTYPESAVRLAQSTDGRSSSDQKLALPPETTSTGRQHLLRHLYHTTLGDWKAAGADLEAALSDSSITPAERVLFGDRFGDLVTTHLISGYAPRAIEALTAALSLLPEDSAERHLMRVKRAACHIVQSFYEDGRREINFVLAEPDLEEHVEACCHCVHAIADAQQGEFERAKTEFQAAEKILKHCDLSHLAAVAIWGPSGHQQDQLPGQG